MSSTFETESASVEDQQTPFEIEEDAPAETKDWAHAVNLVPPLPPLRRVALLDHHDAVGKMYAYTLDDEIFLAGVSFGIWGADAKFRQRCFLLVHTSAAEMFILFCILLQTALLIATIPGHVKDFPLGAADIVPYIDMGLLCIFTIEMILRLIALGVRQGQFAYVKSNWNLLDGALVVASWGALLLELAGADLAIRPADFRILRCLRPLRAVRCMALNMCLTAALSVRDIWAGKFCPRSETRYAAVGCANWPA
jgi:hypothetical protein|eukprot:COSAG01_NODE_4308_length_5145_cov_5.954618_1_plen_253_part_00